MKRFVTSLIAVYILLLFTFAAESDQEYRLYLDLTSEGYTFSDKYTVQIFLDGELLGKAKNGAEFYELLSVTGGTHSVTIQKEKDTKVSYTFSIDVNEDTTIIADIVHEDKIKLKNKEIKSGVSKAETEIPELTQYVLSDARKAYKKLGFTNISATADATIKNEDNWVVISQIPVPGERIDCHEEVQIVCAHTEEYLNDIYVGKSFNKVSAMDHGIYNVIMTNPYGVSIENMTEKQKEAWTVAEVELNKDDYTLELGFIYNPIITLPDINGLRIDQALVILLDAGFENITIDCAETENIKNAVCINANALRTTPGELVRKKSQVIVSVGSNPTYDPNIQEDAYTAATGSAQNEVATSFHESVLSDLSSATDEELTAMIEAIKAEQRARIKTKVVLSDSYLTLDIKINGSKKITAEVIELPEGVKVSGYTWETSDKSVVTCSTNGFVQAVNSGNAVITCSAALSDGTMVEAECKVTVVVKVTSIDFEKTGITIGLGETYTIVPIVRPGNASNNKVRYESSDPSIATVDASGVVTGISAGNVTITVTATDGSEKSNVFRVKVEAKSEVGIAKTSSDKITLTIDKVSTSVGNYLVAPKAGNTFLIINYTIANNSKSSRDVSYDYFAAYSNGYKLDTGNTIWLCDNYNFYEDLDAGGKIRGQVAIEVEKNWREITLKYETSSWFGDTIQFSLYNQY